MNYEIKEILDEMISLISYKNINDYIDLKKKLLDCITNLQEELKDYKQISIEHYKRPYAKRYLKELKKETPNLLYPDSERIYKDYFELKEERDRQVSAFNDLYNFYHNFINKYNLQSFWDEYTNLTKGSDE